MSKRSWLKSVLAAWGGLEEIRRSAGVSPGREIRVLIDIGGRRLHVGTLSEEGDEYVYRYSPEFKDQNEVPPISAFPEVGRVYRAKLDELWTFFRVRLPPTNRQDVKQVISDRGLDEADVMQLLGVIGRRSIATPYELELHAGSA